MLRDINHFVGTHVPAATWDAAQLFLGAALVVLCLLTRRYAPRYSSECLGPVLTVRYWALRAGQVALWGKVVFGIVLVADALQDGYSPPRTAIALLVAVIGLHQLSTLWIALNGAGETFRLAPQLR